MIFNKKDNILILINLSRASGRNLLLGMHKFASKVPNWQIRIIQAQEVPAQEIATTIQTGQYDGIISSEMEIPIVAESLEVLKTPLVVIGTRRRCIPRRTENIVFVTGEEDGIGALGAQTLLSIGYFESYAYVHYSEPEYGYLSFLRKRGFRRIMDRHRKPFTTFGGSRMPNVNGQHELEKWLTELPKPCALMAGCDKRAVEIVDACTRLHIRVPQDISIISVDNDEFLCNSTSPALSSISTNIEKIGYRAAAEMHALLSHKIRLLQPKRVLVPTENSVVERESTPSKDPGISLVKRAIQFIGENISYNIRVSDIALHLHVSRRLLELRFRQFGSETIHEAIDRIRLEEVRKRLRTRKASVKDIARSCGFSNECYMMTKFKTQFGQTIGEYRSGLRLPSDAHLRNTPSAFLP